MLGYLAHFQKYLKYLMVFEFDALKEAYKPIANFFYGISRCLHHQNFLHFKQAIKMQIFFGIIINMENVNL